MEINAICGTFPVQQIPQRWFIRDERKLKNGVEEERDWREEGKGLIQDQKDIQFRANYAIESVRCPEEAKEPYRWDTGVFLPTLNNREFS